MSIGRAMYPSLCAFCQDHHMVLLHLNGLQSCALQRAAMMPSHQVLSAELQCHTVVPCGEALAAPSDMLPGCGRALL